MSAVLEDEDKALSFWLGKPVPRYTSYPPAPAFHAGVGAEAYRDSLRRMTPEQGVSLYFHIPFCRELCLYCGCNTTVTRRADRIEAYLSALKSELRQVAGFFPHKPKVTSIHWGGGTPNILDRRQLQDFFAEIHACCDMSQCGEIAMEIDPRQSDETLAETLAMCGVNRVSLGIQDFNEDVQRLVNRIQSFELVADTCKSLRAQGITRINFDLIYGLPLQTVESVADTARLVCELKPERVAIFSYAHVPQMKKYMLVIEAAGLIDERVKVKMEQISREILVADGYKEIGMDHFSLPQDDMYRALRERKLHRNFQGYTTDASPVLLGLGASSIGRTYDGYFQNERLTETYQSLVAEGKSPVLRGFLLSEEDKLRAAIIEELMCYMNCNIANVCGQFGFPVSQVRESMEKISQMAEQGWVACEGDTVRLLSQHRAAIRVVCRAFDTYEMSKTASKAA